MHQNKFCFVLFVLAFQLACFADWHRAIDVFNSEAKWGVISLTGFLYIYHRGAMCVHQEMSNCVNLGSH